MEGKMQSSNFTDGRNRGITRRGALGALAGAAIGGAAIAARAQGAGQPRAGGIFRMAYSAAPDTLDAQATLNISTQQYSTMVYDNLTSLDENSQAVPSLAVKWTPEKQGQEWVFDLREGVHFHHGTEFSAEDVVATIERAYDKSLALNASGAFGPMQAARAEGKYRVRLVLTQPFGELPVAVANRWGRILPKDRIDRVKTEPSGTGPFRLTDFQPGASMTMTRYPDYWMKDHPYLDTARLVVIRDAVAQQAALRSNDVDFISSISAETFLALRGASGIRTHSTVTGVYQPVMLQANMAPFNNVKRREAFRYILDRKALIASAVFGQGKLGNDVPLPPGSPYLSALPQHEQDLERARKLIAEASVGPIELDFWCSSERPPTPKVALAMKDAAAKIGVTINVRDIPYTEYAANVARKKPLYTANWSGSPTLYESLYLVFHSAERMNYSTIETNPGLDRLLEEIIAEVDMGRRKQLVAQALGKVHDTSDRVVPYFLNYLGATSEKVQGFVPPQYDIIDVRPIWLSA
jgi:peptide/nickel transport system substrate-binding protein